MTLQHLPGSQRHRTVDAEAMSFAADQDLSVTSTLEIAAYSGCELFINAGAQGIADINMLT
jgi:hypothetical protein